MSKNTRDHIFLIFLLLIFVLPLRFLNLSYSELSDDEKKARIRGGDNLLEFFMEQRKGPVQFLVTEITTSITKDPRNEFSLRAPFTLFNIFSVIVCYFVVYRLIKSKPASFVTAFLFLTNGFITGFSRIAQYQNLNLFFSLSALLFYSFLIDKDKKLYTFSLIGILFFCLSVLSHWDAVFYLIPMAYIFIKFLKRKNLSKEYKIRLIIYNFVLGCFLLLPFMIPYLASQLNNPDNIRYFGRRVGFEGIPLDRHLFIFKLYNPFITLYLYFGLSLLGILVFKKTWIYFIWAAVNFALIKFFMPKPGTHIYNYVIPVIFLSGISSGLLVSKLKNILKKAAFSSVLVLMLPLFYQSYMLFVDHSVEYPWESKKVFNRQTQPYIDEEVLTFGFPHFRNWKEINQIMLNDENSCGFYITNEGKEISQIYVDIKYGIPENGCYYVIHVEKPFNNRGRDIVFAQVYRKGPIYKYKRGYTTYAKLYRKN